MSIGSAVTAAPLVAVDRTAGSGQLPGFGFASVHGKREDHQSTDATGTCAFWRKIVPLARIAVLLAWPSDWPIGVIRDSIRPLRFRR
jgi:hypothetical protein